MFHGCENIGETSLRGVLRQLTSLRQLFVYFTSSISADTLLNVTQNLPDLEYLKSFPHDLKAPVVLLDRTAAARAELKRKRQVTAQTSPT